MISQVYFDKVKTYFNGDHDKTWRWFQTRHPAFKMFSPLAYVRLGKQNKVMKHIDDQLKAMEAL